MASGYCYTGVNPLSIRNMCKAAGEPTSIGFFSDCLAFAIVSALYGTKSASLGMSDKKAKKFGTDALKVISTATRCWEFLEKTSTIALSKNAVGAALPEASLVVGSLDESCILPALLQLA